MAQFRFSGLPTELRLTIWEIALYAETRKRLFVVNPQTRSLKLTKHTVPPLLLVNYESRQVAKAFYNVVLAVYISPPFPIYPREDRFAGVVHLNLDRDIFVLAYDSPHGIAVATYNYPFFGIAAMPCKYGTDHMSEVDFGRIQRVLEVKPAARGFCYRLPPPLTSSKLAIPGASERYYLFFPPYTGLAGKINEFLDMVVRSTPDDLPAFMSSSKLICHYPEQSCMCSFYSPYYLIH
ncbi:hypothetical protein GGR52DRAFT_61313 [Hypoxylon sp. FL1284]|nr:hypothetical protein GGR52DRAFT_61313 [Hypoxylon sp. FL1284]